MKRRNFLAAMAAAAGALAAPRDRLARASPAPAQRLIVFYFPDGIVGTSSDGGRSAWHPTGSETAFTLSPQLAALEPFKDRSVVLTGLSSGPTDNGNHPGGAKKLLTGVDHGNGESIDQFVARTVGKAAPHRHLYLGAMANHNGASGDKHVSYVAAGKTATPEDDPQRAFDRLFGAPTSAPAGDDTDASVLDVVLGDLLDLRARVGDAEKVKLDLHLDALRDLEKRIKGLASPAASCTAPKLSTGAIEGKLYEPGMFPAILRAQIDLMVLAMSCGMSKSGVIQGSHHTSELIMSRFPGTEMHDPAFDMRSHQASHYGPRHDAAKREYRDYLAQRRWWVAQLAYLLERLRATPEAGGSMLDHTLVLMCSEVADGNTHSHDDLPFVLAGGAAIRGGRWLHAPGRRHSDLLLSIARAMGESIPSFGEASSGVIPGLLA